MKKIAALEPDLPRLAALGSIAFSVFARNGSVWKCRVFAPERESRSIPATGAAAGPLAVHLARHGRIAFGDEIAIEQGAEVGRPSSLHARARGSRDGLESVEVGGHAVLVGQEQSGCNGWAPAGTGTDDRRHADRLRHGERGAGTPERPRADSLGGRRARSDDVVLLSSMQKTAVVLMHLFHRLGLANEVLFVDTGYHFFETLKMRDEYMRRYRLNVVTLYPASTIEEQETLHGGKLFATIAGQPECCRMRKEAPLLAHLETKRAPVLVNGLRRAEGGKRGNLRPFAEDPPHGRLPAVAALRLERRRRRARTSPSTICSFTRCTTRATRASAATRARRRSSPARTPAPAGGATFAC